MKRFLSSLLVTLILLTGCNSKWTEDNANMPEEFRQEFQAKVDENLAKLKENPEDGEAAFEVAFAYDQLGQFKKAERYYLKTLEINPSNDVSLNNLANLYEKVEEYDKASETIQKLYPLRPTNIETLNDAVRIFLEADDVNDAVLVLEYFSRTKGTEITPEEQQLVSDLYQQTLDYQATHEKK